MIWTTVFPAGFQVMKFGLSIVLARILDPVDFGIIGIAGVILFYSNNFSSLGFGNALIQKKEVCEKDLNTFFTMNLCISIVLALLMCTMAGNLALFFKIPELRDVLICLSTIFLSSSLYMIPMIELKRRLLFKEVVKVDMVKESLSILTAICLALMGFRYWAIVCGQIGSYLMATVLIRRKTAWQPCLSFDRTSFNELKGVAVWNFFVVQVNLLAEQFDKLLIGKFLGPYRLGFYDKAFSIGAMPLLFFSRNVSSVAFATFSRHQEDPGSLSYYLSRTMVLNTVVAFPCYTGLFSIADQFVRVLLGEKWVPMVPGFKILLFAFMISSVTSVLDNLNLSCGRHRALATLKFSATVVLAVALWYSAAISIEAVCQTIALYYGALLAGSTVIAGHTLPLGFRRLASWILPAALGSVILFAGVTLAETYVFTQDSVLDLFMLILSGIMFYVLGMLLMDFEQARFLRQELAGLARKILGR
jgi:O-antigen/teichoic acid export membrane protein